LLSPLTPLLCSRASPLPQPSLSSGPTSAHHRSVSHAPLSRGYRQVGGTCHPPPSVAPSRTRAWVRAARFPR
jgi:hypothetical protein